MIVQELIPGDGEQQFAYCALFRDGEPLASMVAQRRRQHPLEFGRASTYVETVEMPELEELACRFLRSIDYYGLVELEFKLDPRDGVAEAARRQRPHLGLPHARRRGGRRLPLPALPRPARRAGPAAPRATPARSWVRLVTDLPTGVLEILSRRTALLDYLRSLRGDPTPRPSSRATTCCRGWSSSR